jgi:hypothetical protein
MAFGLGADLSASVVTVVWHLLSDGGTRTFVDILGSGVLWGAGIGIVATVLIISVLAGQRTYGRRLPRLGGLRPWLWGLVYGIGLLVIAIALSMEWVEGRGFFLCLWGWLLGFVVIASYRLTEFCPTHRGDVFFR